MKKLLPLLLLSLPCAAQISYPPPNPTVLCRISTPASNTGNTGANTYLAGTACKISAGTLSATSQITVTALFARTSGTGTCIGAIWMGTSSGALTNVLGTTNAVSAIGYTFSQVINAGSASSQTLIGAGYGNGYGASASYSTSSINTATTDMYINASEQNSVSTDNCSLISEVVQLLN